MPESDAHSAPIDQLSAMLEEFQREKAATLEQRKEIGVLVRQTVAEIDRLAQVNREIPAQIRQLEANLEAFPRAEIQRIHSAAREAQMRQFMMQSQLEQLRSREANLERVAELLDRILLVVDRLLVRRASAGASSSLLAVAAGPDGRYAEAALQSIELAHQRISRQLQDRAAQALTDLILRAQVCQRLLEMDPEKTKEEMAGLKEAASVALRSIRQLFYDLLPPALEELGLVAALERYVETAHSSEKLRIDLQVAGQVRRLPQKTELAVFRILQEALTNAARHSGAGRAEIRLRFEPGQLIATVADEGRGFDVTQALIEADQKPQSGLSDMQLRAELIGGTLEIGSKSGAGCMISLAVPV